MIDTKCKCGKDLSEEIKDKIDDSRKDQFDGYTDCKTVLVICTCDTVYDVEYDDNREVIAFVEDL